MKRSLSFVWAALLFVSCVEPYADNEQICTNEQNCVNENDVTKSHSTSGSRLIFNEYAFPDGSVYYDNNPIDTKYSRHCTVITGSSNYTVFNGFEGCCVSYKESFSLPISNDYYTDPACTNPSTTTVASLNMLKEGDIVLVQHLDSYEKCVNVTHSIGIVEPITSDSSLYYGTPSNCFPALQMQECGHPLNFYKVKILTTKEARALFVCAE